MEKRRNKRKASLTFSVKNQHISFLSFFLAFFFLSWHSYFHTHKERGVFKWFCALIHFAIGGTTGLLTKLTCFIIECYISSIHNSTVSLAVKFINGLWVGQLSGEGGGGSFSLSCHVAHPSTLEVANTPVVYWYSSHTLKLSFD